MKDYVHRYLSTALGVLFLWSAGYKLLFPGQATISLETLDFSLALANSVIAAVTAIELYIGSILLLRRDLKWGLISAGVLMMAFTVYMWFLSTLADPPKCGCFGLGTVFKSSKHEAAAGVFRNVFILFLVMTAYDHHFGKKANPIAERNV
jgi:hypothetical protein